MWFDLMKAWHKTEKKSMVIHSSSNWACDSLCNSITFWSSRESQTILLGTDSFLRLSVQITVRLHKATQQGCSWGRQCPSSGCALPGPPYVPQRKWVPEVHYSSTVSTSPPAEKNPTICLPLLAMPLWGNENKELISPVRKWHTRGNKA